MTPMQIIQKFRLDISTDERDFILAADYCDDCGFHAMANDLRSNVDYFMARESKAVDSYGANSLKGYGRSYDYGYRNLSVPHYGVELSSGFRNCGYGKDFGKGGGRADFIGYGINRQEGSGSGKAVEI